MEQAGGVRSLHCNEAVSVAWEAEAHFFHDLPYGFESRRGLCRLVRVDCSDPHEGDACTTRSVR